MAASGRKNTHPHDHAPSPCAARCQPAVEEGLRASRERSDNKEGKGTGQPTASSVLKLGKCPATSSEHGTGGPAAPLIRQDHRPRRTLSSCEPHHRSTPRRASRARGPRGGATGTARPPAPGLQPTPPVQSVAIGVICPGPGHLRPAGPGPRPRRGGQLRRRDVPLVPAAATYWYPYTCSGDVLRVIIIARIKDLSRALITDRQIEMAHAVYQRGLDERRGNWGQRSRDE